MRKEEPRIMPMTMPSTNMNMKMEPKTEQKEENEENVKPLLQVGFCFLMVKIEIKSFSCDMKSSCQTYLKFSGGHQEHVEDGEESVQLLCCSFQKYLHCSESVVNTTCGYETARFTKSFLDRMSGPLIQVKMQHLSKCVHPCIAP